MRPTASRKFGTAIKPLSTQETPAPAARLRPPRAATAVATPMGTAPSAATRKESTERASVVGKRSASVSATGRWERSETPRSPWSRPVR